MNWNNLKNSKCPKCESLLKMGNVSDMTVCSDTNCDFRIRNYKLDMILRGTYLKRGERLRSEEDNLEALNNLGHDLIKEDFSDSPYTDRP